MSVDRGVSGCLEEIGTAVESDTFISFRSFLDSLLAAGRSVGSYDDSGFRNDVTP